MNTKPQPSIEFTPDLAAGKGGRIFMHEPVSGQEVFDSYIEWLVTEHPEHSAEIYFDPEQNSLMAGLWEIDVEFDPELVSFEVCGELSAPSGLEQIEESAAVAESNSSHGVDITSLPAAQAFIEADHAAKTDAKAFTTDEVAAILSTNPQLNVVRIHDRATMVEANAFAKASTIPTGGGMTSFSPAGAVAEIKSSGSVDEIKTLPSINSNKVQTPRVMIVNQPAQQRRIKSYFPQETTIMANPNQSRQYDDRPSRRGEDRSNKAFPKRRDTEQPRFQQNNRGAAPKLADPEMISKLLVSGIGSAAVIDTEAFARGLRERAQQRWSGRSEQLIDGETCINTSAAAETQLGMALRLSQNRVFTYPNFGEFQSLTGLYLMLTENPCQDAYRGLHSARANKVLHGNFEYRREYAGVQNLTKEDFDAGCRGYYDLRTIYAVMGDALWITVNKDPNLVMELLNNQLPLECYTWVRMDSRDEGEKANANAPKQRIRHEVYGKWYLPLVREVVRCLRARYDAALAGKPLEELPRPDFTHAIDIGIGRLRRQMGAELERRKQGYATPVDEAYRANSGINESIFGKQRAGGRVQQNPKPAGNPVLRNMGDVGEENLGDEDESGIGGQPLTTAEQLKVAKDWAAEEKRIAAGGSDLNVLAAESRPAASALLRAETPLSWPEPGTLVKMDGPEENRTFGDAGQSGGDPAELLVSGQNVINRCDLTMHLTTEVSAPASEFMAKLSQDWIAEESGLKTLDTLAATAEQAFAGRSTEAELSAKHMAAADGDVSKAQSHYIGLLNQPLVKASDVSEVIAAANGPMRDVADGDVFGLGSVQALEHTTLEEAAAAATPGVLEVHTGTGAQSTSGTVHELSTADSTD